MAAMKRLPSHHPTIWVDGIDVMFSRSPEVVVLRFDNMVGLEGKQEACRVALCIDHVRKLQAILADGLQRYSQVTSKADQA